MEQKIRQDKTDMCEKKIIAEALERQAYLFYVTLFAVVMCKSGLF